MKIRNFLFIGALLLGLSAQVRADTIDYPFKSPSDRQKAAALLSKDPEFINLLVLNVFQSKMGGATPEQLMSQMLGGNMTLDNGMMKESPAVSESAPKKVEMKDGGVSGMVGENQNGMKADALTVQAQEKAGDVLLPADPSVENVDFFISLSCDHCRKFWKNLVNDDIVREHLLDDKINIRVIPNSTADAGIIIIFETLKERDKGAARDFLTWYFSGGKDSDEKVMFAGAEKWLAEHKYPGLQDIHNDKELLKRIGGRVEQSIALDQKLDAAYPSIYVNGKEDGSYFTKAREHIISQLPEKQEKK